MNYLNIFLIFLITYIINFYVNWYNPFQFNFIKQKHFSDIYNQKYIIVDIHKNKKLFNQYYYKHKLPIILDARTLYEYNWNNFDIPLYLLKDHFVSCNDYNKINNDNFINNSMNTLFNNDDKSIQFLSMFNSSNYKLLDKLIYTLYPLPKQFQSLYSSYLNDIIINVNSNYKTPYFYVNNTYHIFFIVKGEVKINFLSRDVIKNPTKLKFNNFYFMNQGFKTIDSFDYETNNNSIVLKENSLILIPNNYFYNLEFDFNNSIILSYYYSSFLNKIINKCYNLKVKNIN